MSTLFSFCVQYCQVNTQIQKAVGIAMI